MLPARNRWQRHGQYPFLMAKVFFWVGMVAALLAILVRLNVVVVPVLGGFFVAYILGPIAERLHKWHAPRMLAVLVPVGIAVALLAAVGLVLIPRLFGEFSDFMSRIPGYVESMQETVPPMIETYLGVEVAQSFDLRGAERQLRAHATEVLSSTGWLVQTILASLASLGSFLFSGLLLVVVTVYLLGDYRRVVATILDLIPVPAREDANRLLKQVDETISAFIHGQLLVASIVGSVYCLALSILGVPFAVLIGVVSGLLNMVPYVGPASGMAFALGIAALEFSGFGQLAGIGAVYAVVPFLDALFVTPNIVGNRVGLPPLVVLLGIVAFGDLLGVVGILIAVPVLAVARIVTLEILRVYKDSSLYLGS